MNVIGFCHPKLKHCLANSSYRIQTTTNIQRLLIKSSSKNCEFSGNAMNRKFSVII